MKKKISIVTPCFNEFNNIVDCYNSIKILFDGDDAPLANYDFEHIFCDNYSTDGTKDILTRLAAEDRRVKVIFNSRNFGAFRNMYNGIKSASGDAVVAIIPADRQDPPEMIANFVSEWERGYKVIYGVKNKREEGLLLRSLRKIYYRWVDRLASFSIPQNVGEFHLLDREVVNWLCMQEDYYPYVRGMIAYCGFASKEIPYTWRARTADTSKVNWYVLIDTGLNGLISFGTVPTRIMLGMGAVVATLSLIVALIVLVHNLLYFGELAPRGIPMLTISMFFFFGVQFFILGIIGEYVLAIHAQVRKRPMVVEEGRLNFDK